MMLIRNGFRACAAVFLLLLAGCATPDDVMKSWMGKHQGDLIQAWGPPQQTSSDGRGGTVLIYGSYVDMGQVPGQVQRNAFGGVSYTAPVQQGYQRTRMFYVDTNGYVYSYRWQGM